MDQLEQIIEAILQRPTRGDVRDQIIAALDGVATDCETAIRVWLGYLDTPGAPGNTWTILSWIGPARAKQLHEINLSAKVHVGRLAEIAGPALSRFAALGGDVIEMGYRQLRTGETGADVARSAVAKMQEHIARIQVFKERIRTMPVATKPRPQSGPLKKAGTTARPIKSAGGTKPKPKTGKKKTKKE